MIDIILLIICCLATPFIMKLVIENDPNYRRGLAEYNAWRKENET